MNAGQQSRGDFMPWHKSDLAVVLQVPVQKKKSLMKKNMRRGARAD
jgi:hypothetical protein